MKRGAALKQKTPLRQGSKGLARSEFKRKAPMPCGAGQIARQAKPMKPVGARAKRMGQGRVAPTAQERAWLDAIVAYGCLVCWRQYGVQASAEVHHMKSGDRRMGHLYSLPLCADHHRGGAGEGMFISRHPYKRRFEAAYGSELDLLAELRAALAAGAPVPSSVIVAV
jgi:hypothetical protein